jgi:hypothetical protein
VIALLLRDPCVLRSSHRSNSARENRTAQTECRHAGVLEGPALHGTRGYLSCRAPKSARWEDRQGVGLLGLQTLSQRAGGGLGARQRKGYNKKPLAMEGCNAKLLADRGIVPVFGLALAP